MGFAETKEEALKEFEGYKPIEDFTICQKIRELYALINQIDDGLMREALIENLIPCYLMAKRMGRKLIEYKNETRKNK